jgi:hypothetical protein
MVSKPGKEALWFFMLSLSAGFILCLTGAFRQILNEKIREFFMSNLSNI